TESDGMQVIPGAVADSFATEINASSTIVGATHDESYFGTVDPPVAQVWYGDGTLDSIPSGLGGAAAIALGLNDDGTVVGFAEDGSHRFHAFMWTTSAGMHALPSLGYCVHTDYDLCSVAAAVNSSGDIVGNAAYG